MSTRKIKVGVAGVGFIGPVHIESLRRLPDIEVVAITHSDLEGAKDKAKQLGVTGAYDDFNAMVDTENLHSVHICTPNNLHYPQVKYALQKGLHVICDKPLALTVDEGMELLELAQASGKVHAINFNVRYYPLVREMRQMRIDGRLGKLYSLQGSYLQDWLFKDTDYNWRLEKAQSGSSKAVADIGSHLLDLMEYISGDPITAVCANFTTAHPVRKKPKGSIETYSGKVTQHQDFEEVPVYTEDVAHILLKFSSGAQGVASVSQVNAGRKNQIRLECAGSNCSFAWNSEQPNHMWIGQRDVPNQLLFKDPALLSEAARPLSAYPGGHQEGFADTSKQLFSEVYAAIKEGKAPENPSYPTFADGLREQYLCDKIVESQDSQQWQDVAVNIEKYA